MPATPLYRLMALPSYEWRDVQRSNGQVTATARLLSPQGELEDLCVVPITRKPPGPLVPQYEGAADWAMQVKTFKAWKIPTGDLGPFCEAHISYDFSTAPADVHAVAGFFLMRGNENTFDLRLKLEKWLKNFFAPPPISPLAQLSVQTARLTALTKGLEAPITTVLKRNP